MKRLEMQAFLETFIKDVYYQPPSNLKMNFPCIVYSRTSILKNNANNNVYIQNVGYTVTYIDSNPDSETVEKLLAIPTARYDRDYVHNNLRHTVLTIY